jgi:hypothetical protein
MAKRTEKDGDIHIQLKVDPGQGRGWMNQKNVTKQKGNLVIEPICVRRVTQDSALEACRGFIQNIIIPKKGDHVELTGVHVVDNERNHGWREIHPITTLIVLP